jgi:hypothetical protein
VERSLGALLAIEVKSFAATLGSLSLTEIYSGLVSGVVSSAKVIGARRCEIERCRSPGHVFVLFYTPASAFARSVRPCPYAGSMVAVMLVSIGLFWGASHATSNGRIRPEGRLKPRSPSRNGYAGFFSPAAK